MKKYILIILLLVISNSLHSQVVKFAAFGDYGGFTENGGVGELAVANMVKSWDTDPSFFIITLGDNNYFESINGQETIDRNIGQFYHQYIYPYNQAGFSPGYSPNPQTVNRFFPALGNHDHYGNPVYAYYIYFAFTNIDRGNSSAYPGGIRYYDFQKGNVHFFCLNSGVDPSNHTGFNFYSEPDGIDSNSVQGQWLKSKLMQSTSKWKIVYFHHPPYYSLYNYPENSYSALRYPFKRWGANVVLCGHLHTYEKLFINGVTYITNGLGGDSYGNDSAYQPAIPGSLVRYSANYGALKCEAHTDSLVFRFINVDNQIVDYWKITENSIGPLPSKLYVNDNSLSENVYTTAIGNDLNSGSPGTPFATIARAILVAKEGDTIMVDAGTYSENPVVSKSLTFIGANTGVSGYSSRNAESIVRTNGNQNSVFTVSANNVSIDGFTINGNDTAITGSSTASGADVNANCGVLSAGSNLNLIIRNNIIKNVFNGIKGDSLSSGNLISQNLFNDIGNFNNGAAIVLQNDFYSNVLNNKMSKVWTGIFLNNFSLADGPSSWIISENEIHSYAAGLCYWNHRQNATSLSFNNNKIFADSAAVSNNFGMLLVSIKDSLNPSFNGNKITGTEYGIGLFDISTLNNIYPGLSDTISATTKSGILFTNNLNFNPVDTSNFTINGPGDDSKLNIGGVTISPLNGAGIILDANGGTSAEINIVTPTIITGGTDGIIITGAASSVTGNSLNNLSFNGQTGKYISLGNDALNGLLIDATGSSFDGSTGDGMSIEQNFITEDKINHSIDRDSLGFILVKNGNDFVTLNSYVSPYTDTPSIQRGINIASTGFTVNISNGVYNEDIEINKRLSLTGQSPSSVIKGLYSGNENTILISSDSTIIKSLTVTRDYGFNIASWHSSNKSSGICFGQNTTGIKIENAVITGNRTGIIINNSQNASVTNCLIDSNYSGIIFSNNINGSVLKNCFIKNNFTQGVLFDYDAGELSAVNSDISNNNISGNWYSQVNFQRDTGTAPAGDHSGLSFNCNWFGTNMPSTLDSSSVEPDYTFLIPPFFGGADPGLNNSLLGIESSRIPYIPWLAGGADADSVAEGFQPLDSCNGYPLLQLHRFYVNDTDQTGDIFTTAHGNDSNSGTFSAPFFTLTHAVSIAAEGDTVIVDAGSYADSVSIDKKIIILGTNADISPNTGVRVSESILSGGNSIIINSTDKILLTGFRFTSAAGYTINSNITGANLLLEKNLFEGSAGMNFNFPDSLFFTDNKFKDIDSLSSECISVTGNFNGSEGTFLEIKDNSWADCKTIGIRLKYVKGNISKNNFNDIYNYGIILDSMCNLNINRNVFNRIIRSNDSSQTAGSGIFFNYIDTASIVNISENYFTNNVLGISFSTEGILTSSNVMININSFSENDLGNINNLTGDILTASCNWFGSSNVNTIASRMSSKIKFFPYITNGIDIDESTYGFQSADSSCNGDITKFYVNDNSLEGDSFTTETGNDNNTGILSAPVATLSRAVSLATSGDTICLDAGIYNEDIVINKRLNIIGASSSSVIKGLYSGNENTILISSDSTIIKSLTVTRDYGFNIASWHSSNKSSGICFGQNTTGIKIENAVITGNRTGIIINNSQNASVTNCLIDSNYSGIIFSNNINGSVLKNCFIKNNFTQGVLFDYDAGELSAVNSDISNNNISGNWYSQVNFQRDTGTAPAGDHSGLSFNCNWFGTNMPSTLDSSSVEPDYTFLIPPFFGGADPGLNNSLLGIESSRIPYIPWLAGGADADSVAEGFQPLDSCNGYPLLQLHRFYVNDTDQTGDIFTTAHGNDSNSGTFSAPFFTLTHAVSIAAEGDTVIVDAGSYADSVSIDKKIIILGTNADISPNTGVRVSESILSGGNSIIINSTDKILLTGFRFTSAAGYTINSNITGANLLLEKNLFEGSAGMNFNFPDSLFFTDNKFKDIDSLSSECISVTGNFNGSEGTFLEIKDNSWADCKTIGIRLKYVKGNISKNNFNDIYNYGIILDSMCNLNINRNVFNRIIRSNDSSQTAGSGIFFNYIDTASIVNISENYFTNNVLGISFSTEGILTSSNVMININSFSENDLGNINNLTGDILTASCNWFGSSNVNTIASRMSSKIKFFPYITNGIDIDESTYGFQSADSSCNGDITKFYVNDNSLEGDSFTTETGNDNNTGILSAPVATLSRAVSLATSGDTICLDAGIYNEDIVINKRLNIIGASSSSVIKGLYSGNENTILISSDSTIIKSLTVTRDYGFNIASWHSSNKSSGICFGQNTTGIKIENAVITGNRTGIIINNSQNASVTNCLIDSNYSGIIFSNNINGSVLKNCFIKNNFTQGVLFDYDAGELSAVNSDISNNNISGNWYSQVNFQRDTGTAPAGDHSGLSFNCNWFGTNMPSTLDSSSVEPDYTFLIPPFFGGADPGLNNSLLGIESSRIPYIPWLAGGADADSVAEGFQPLDSCNGYPLLQLHRFYVNDTDQTGDIFTTAHGNDSNSGTFSAPFFTLTHAVSIAAEGDTVIVDAGSYADSVSIDKKIIILGTNADISPNTGVRVSESILSGGNSIIINSTDKILLTGFRFTSAAGYTINSNITGANLLLEKNLFEGSAGMNFNFPDSLFFTDNKFKDIDSLSSECISVTGNFNGSEGTFLEIKDNSWADCKTIGIRLKYVKGNISKNNFNDIYNYGIILDSMCNLNINRNVFNRIIRSNDSSQTAGSGIFFNYIDTASIVNISENYFTNNVLGISFSTEGILTSSNVMININSFSENDLGNINNLTGDILTASCNWFGSSNVNTIASRMSSKIKFFPYITNGIDIDESTYGFQSADSSCNGDITKFYVNDNSLEGDSFTTETGNDNNTGILSAPVATLSRAVSLATSGDTICLDAGIYNEDIVINKRLNIIGASSSSVIKGLYSGNENTILISSDSTIIKSLTVTRDYGFNIASWHSSNKSSGICFGQNTTGIKIENAVITGNRTGIIINNSQNASVTNCLIDSNYSGIIFSNNINGSVLKNCFIKNNFTQGVLFDYDAGELSAVNSDISNNNISGNWYSQVNFQRDTGTAPAGDHSGLSFNCNWYGTSLPLKINVNAAEPGYQELTPVQFGGADPGLNRQLYGVEIARCFYNYFLTDGTDDDLLSVGFQPVPASCNGVPVSILNIKIFPQGMYNISTQMLNLKDTAVAYLNSNISPYNVLDSSVSVIDSVTFTGTFTFTQPGGTYYISVKHRNSIETWSKTGGEIFTASTVMNYDFTDISGKAFLNNIIQVDSTPVRFGIYSGDVNQDGVIDLADITAVFNDITNFINGYTSTDITGENIVDLSDLVITYNNSSAFAEIKKP